MSRAPTQELINEIVARYRPRGYRIRESEHRWKWETAEVCNKKREIAVPTLNDAGGLFLFAHEVGHVVLGHFKIALATHLEEFEAEKFAINLFRCEDITVTAAILDLARCRVRHWIDRDIKKGRPIKRHVARWAKHRCYSGRKPNRRDHQRSR